MIEHAQQEAIAKRQQQIYSEYAHTDPVDAVYELCRRHATLEVLCGAWVIPEQKKGESG